MLEVKLTPGSRAAAAARIDAARSVFLAALQAEFGNLTTMEIACEVEVTAQVMRQLVDLTRG